MIKTYSGLINAINIALVIVGWSFSYTLRSPVVGLPLYVLASYVGLTLQNV